MSGLALLLLFDPNASNSIFPPCLFHALSGLYCPGCGATRALHALLHGDIPRAWSMNPLLTVSLPAVVALTAHDLRLLPIAWDSAVRPIGNARLWALSVIAFGILRNVPAAPLSWLAPG